MKKITLVLALAVAISFFAAQNAKAALLDFTLDLPDIFSDSTGVYSYNATTDLFSATATALTITFDGTTIVPITNGSYQASFYVDSTGALSGGVAGNDIEIWGNIDVDGDSVYEYSGLLVAGEVKAFGWNDTGSQFDLFNYVFDATGGALAPFYTKTGGPYNGGDFMSIEISTFTGDFTTDFSGSKTKHDTAPITPEPTSMVMLGSGLLGLAFAGFRKKKHIA